jgi:hypothetical protein
MIDTVTRTRPRHRETELWRMRKDERECRCVAVYLPTGIDVRFFEGKEMQRMWPSQTGGWAHRAASVSSGQRNCAALVAF